MREQIQNNIYWFLPIVVISLSGAFLPSVVTGALYILFLLFCLWKNLSLEFLLGYFLLLFFSDSFQDMFAFAATFKPIGTLMLPVFYLKIRNQTAGLKHDFLLQYIPYLAIAAFMMVFAQDFFFTFQKTLSYVITIVFLPLLVKHELEKDAVQVFQSFMFALIIIFFLGVVIKYVNYQFVAGRGRFSGMLGNPNGLGIFCVLSFGFYKITNELHRNSIHRYAKIVFLGLVLISVFWSASRASMMSILILQFFSYIFSIHWMIGWVSFGFLVFFYETIIAWIPIVTNYLGFEDELRTESVEDIKQGSGRQLAREFAFWKIKQSVFIGKGIGYTEQLYKEWYDWLAIRGHQGNAHNSYLTHWLDTGLLGVIAFYSATVGTLVKLSKYNRMAMPFLFAVLFSIFYESWLTSSLNPFTPFFLICVTTLFYGYRKEKGRIEALQAEQNQDSDNTSDTMEMVS